MNYEKIKKDMITFINQQIQNFNGAVVGLSGGLDSAIVLSLLANSNKQAHALIMPTKFSNPKNYDDALNLAKMLDVKHSVIDIQDILDSFIKASKTSDKIQIGNFAARIRMTLLYDYSAKHNLLVAGTSNKSELMLGYGTIYGDLACAFNVLAQFYKSELFAFADFLGIPKQIINKKPSADLFEGQDDESEIGFTYEQIDNFLQNFQNNTKIEPVYSSLLNRIEKNKFKQEGIKIFKR